MPNITLTAPTAVFEASDRDGLAETLGSAESADVALAWFARFVEDHDLVSLPGLRDAAGRQHAHNHRLPADLCDMPLCQLARTAGLKAVAR